MTWVGTAVDTALNLIQNSHGLLSEKKKKKNERGLGGVYAIYTCSKFYNYFFKYND